MNPFSSLVFLKDNLSLPATFVSGKSHGESLFHCASIEKTLLTPSILISSLNAVKPGPLNFAH
jgi:hypothetical protein